MNASFKMNEEYIINKFHRVSSNHISKFVFMFLKRVLIMFEFLINSIILKINQEHS